LEPDEHFEDGCPFCGDPHPAENDEEGPDFHTLPGCDHYVGRYDPDGGPGNEEFRQLDGGFAFLEDLEFPALRGGEEPTDDDLAAAFGEYLGVADATYADGFHDHGYARDLMFEMAERLHLVECVITGSMLWSCTEYYAPNAGKSLDEIERAARAVVNGVASLNAKHTSVQP
jgi:hypothetical protein